MCLDTKLNKAYITDRDIICWKVIYKNKKTKRLSGYYQRDFSYKRNVVLIEKSFNLYSDSRNQVYKGFHSYKFLWGALKHYVFQINNSTSRDYKKILVKCMIPKGSYIFDGKFCEDSSYASNQIIIK